MRIATRYILALALGGLLAAPWGCASGQRFSANPWSKAPPDTIPGVKNPAERIDELQELARTAPQSSPEQQQRTSAELAEQIKNEKDPLVRIQIVRALSGLRTPMASAVLQAALGDTDADVRVACCDVWGRRGGPEAVQELNKVLGSDTNIDVRLAAARALGQTKDPTAITALADALSDSDPAMQRRAVESLRTVSDKDFGNDARAWQEYAKGGTPQVKQPSIAERMLSLFY